ncbi:MAG: hypothetical protein RXR41_03465 [Candidatus Marsarchaeota archaeon]
MLVKVVLQYDEPSLAKAVFVGTNPDNSAVPGGQAVREEVSGSSVVVEFEGDGGESFLYTVEDFFDKEELCVEAVRAVASASSPTS